MGRVVSVIPVHLDTIQSALHPYPQFGRMTELDVLYVRPKGDGQGWPESLPLIIGGEGWGEGVHIELKV